MFEEHLVCSIIYFVSDRQTDSQIDKQNYPDDTLVIKS